MQRAGGHPWRGLRSWGSSPCWAAPARTLLPTDPPQPDESARETLADPAALRVAREFARFVEQRDTLTVETYKEIIGLVKKATGQKGRHLFHPIRAALTGCGSGPELERLIPIYEGGSRLHLPRRVMSCRERLAAVLKLFPNGE